jgi:serine/threonine protein kinase
MKEAMIWIDAAKIEARYHELDQKYAKLELIGKGKFSEVFMCKDVFNDKIFALKQIDKESLTMREKEFLKEEIQIIRQIKHPNVVEMMDVFENKGYINIIMECVEGGELFDHVKNN